MVTRRAISASWFCGFALHTSLLKLYCGTLPSVRILFSVHYQYKLSHRLYTTNSSSTINSIIMSADTDDAANDPYFYTKLNEFTSELYKIEVSNLPGKFGYVDFKKRLASLDLMPKKIKLIGSSKLAYVTFSSEEERTKAIEVINKHVWKSKALFARKAKPIADPMVMKRKAQSEVSSDEKRSKLFDNGDDDDGDDDNDDDTPISDRLNQTVSPLWKVPYSEQLKIKQASVEEVLKQTFRQLERDFSTMTPWLKEQRLEHGLHCCNLQSILPSPVTEKYRNKCEFTIGTNTHGQEKVVGFRLGKYKGGSIIVEHVSECVIIPDTMKAVTKMFEACLSLSELSSFDPNTHSGCWKQLTVRMSNCGHVMIFPEFKMHSDQTQADVEAEISNVVGYFTVGPGKDCGVTSIYFNTVHKARSQPGNTRLKHITGAQTIEEEILGLKFRVSPTAFFQVNTKAAEVLYETIGHWVCECADASNQNACNKDVTEQKKTEMAIINEPTTVEKETVIKNEKTTGSHQSVIDKGKTTGDEKMMIDQGTTNTEIIREETAFNYDEQTMNAEGQTTEDNNEQTMIGKGQTTEDNNEQTMIGKGQTTEDNNEQTMIGKGQTTEDNNEQTMIGKGQTTEDNNEQTMIGKGQRTEDNNEQMMIGKGQRTEDNNEQTMIGKGQTTEDNNEQTIISKGQRTEDNNEQTMIGKGQTTDDDNEQTMIDRPQTIISDPTIRRKSQTTVFDEQMGTTIMTDEQTTGVSSSDTVLLDICCGTGTIGLTLAQGVGRVIGIEMCEEAVVDARENAKLNGIANAEFLCGKAEHLISSVISGLTSHHVVAVVDPPRPGLHNKVIHALRGCNRLKQLVYVSCSPKSAKTNFIDLMRPESKRLRGAPFTITKAVPIDLFPHTSLCELVILFQR